MGVCDSSFESSSIQNKMSNASITKCYLFNQMKLKNLEELNNYTPEKEVKIFSACDNNLDSLPNLFFEKINKIIKLDFSKNKFAKIDPITFKFYSSLQILNFSYNKISLIDLEIKNFIKLKELILSNNSISIIPYQLSELENLETLDLSYNLILDIPDSIVKMSKLSFIDLNHNLLKYIPDKNWDKSSIIQIDLGFNDIQIIPNEILEFSKITRLYLKGNKNITISMLRDCPGYVKFELRRKSVKDQGFINNLDISFSQCGLD